MSPAAVSPLRGLHLHFDPSSGIAGDMTVAALVDAGVPARVVTDVIGALGLSGLKVGFEPRTRGAFAGQGFRVRTSAPKSVARSAAGQRAHRHEPKQPHDHDHTHDHTHDHAHDHDHPHEHDHHVGHAHDHRPYAEIRRLLRRAPLDSSVRALAERIFARIAQVEAALHGVSVDEVAFHEIGAWDSIADIVGAAAALAWLAPASISATAPVLGTGRVRTQHGLVPVPAPATAALLYGVPVVCEGQGELTTPTGAAILAELVPASGWGPPPALRLVASGFGAGTRELPDRPNGLRVLLGARLGTAVPNPPPDVWLLQANIDDMSPQLIEPLITALLAAGALDAWTTPIVMKKGRPAFEVSALVAPERRDAVEPVFFTSSTTLGVRALPASRTVLDRAFTQVPTPFGEVRVKLASRAGQVLTATPEFDDCQQLAAQAAVPVREVLAAAVTRAADLVTSSRASLPPRKRKRT